MLKNLIIYFLIFTLGLLTFNNESQAFFFKKKGDKNHTKSEQADQVGGKKILVVEIFASWCPGCKNIQPTLDQLIKETPDIDFLQLNVSTPSKAKISEKTAKELKLTEFYELNKSKTATVGIVVPSSGEIVSVFQNNNDIEEYKTSIEEARTKEKALTQE
ncbi:MAG: hypothetical protein A3B68_08680 [Candidatus Melainabacteria bacterium RIFCSPHIGHO2_02_FULL_34_12]|nr:MAG: hypothetical protein A3B68_08680 [Candidatus Melainabacteria bacterium RIFCSPHIGHO2_02_FULL_34_12]